LSTHCSSPLSPPSVVVVGGVAVVVVGPGVGAEVVVVGPGVGAAVVVVGTGFGDAVVVVGPGVGADVVVGVAGLDASGDSFMKPYPPPMVSAST